MDAKLFFLIIFLLLSSTFVAADEASDFKKSIFYRGDLFFELEKSLYLAGDEMNISATLSNMENFSIVDAYLVVELVSGGNEHVYPSQISDEDNIFYEKVIGGITIPASSKKDLTFSVDLPSNLKSGGYRIECYLKNDRTPVVGVPQIILAPKDAAFNVSGDGDFPYVKILRTGTFFLNENFTGPIGAGVPAGSEVGGVVYVKNLRSRDVTGLVLNVSLYDWEDTSSPQERMVWSDEYPLDLPAEEFVGIAVNFSAPNKPNAYAIRLEVKESSGRTVSLYRHRIIVYGGAARIRKMAINDARYLEGAEGRVMLLISASPDHYTLPALNNANVSVNISVDDSVVYADSAVVPEISMNVEGGFVYVDYPFVAPRELTDFTLCSAIKSETGQTYDNYCYSVNVSAWSSKGNALSHNWSYDSEKGLLSLGFCSEDGYGDPSNTSVDVLLLRAGRTQSIAAFREGLLLNPCNSVFLEVSGGDYILIITDVQTQEQSRSQLNLPMDEPRDWCGDGICGLEEDSSGSCCIDCGCCEDGPCDENDSGSQSAAACGDGTCSPAENSKSCCIDCGCPRGDCLDGVCREDGGYAPLMTYFIFGAILILAGFVYYSSRKKGGKK